MPLISVVLPTYNRAYVLWRAVSSVLAQTLVDLELIVVDDGSSDCTARLLEEFHDPRIRVLTHQGPPRGAAASRNAGTLIARAELIAQLDSDNAWRPEYLERMAEAAGHEPDCALFYCGQVTMLWERTREREWFEISRREVHRAQYSLDDARDLRWPDVNCMVYRRELAVEIGGFDASLQWLDDWDFFFRAIRAYPQGCRWVPGLWVDYRQVHGEGADGVCSEARESGEAEAVARRKLLAKWEAELSDSAQSRLGLHAEDILPLRAPRGPAHDEAVPQPADLNAPHPTP